MNQETVTDLLRNAVVEGDDASLDALVAVGPVAVEVFRDWLQGDLSFPLPPDRGRLHIDTSMTISCKLAVRFPDAFLGCFSAEKWLGYDLILEGLGWTGRSEARPMLIEALLSNASGFTRRSAASALGFIPGSESVQALLRVLDDPDDLLRYDALRSLGSIGDEFALGRVLPLAANPPSDFIGEAASKAARSIGARIGVEIDLPEVHRTD